MRPPSRDALPEWSEDDSLLVVLGAVLSAAGIGDRSPLLDNELAPLAEFDSSSTVEAERAAFERLGELHARGQRIVLYLLEPDYRLRRTRS